MCIPLSGAPRFLTMPRMPHTHPHFFCFANARIRETRHAIMLLRCGSSYGWQQGLLQLTASTANRATKYSKAPMSSANCANQTCGINQKPKSKAVWAMHCSLAIDFIRMGSRPYLEAGPMATLSVAVAVLFSVKIAWCIGEIISTGVESHSFQSVTTIGTCRWQHVNS